MADIRRQAEKIGHRSLASIFFGGGTPSLMAPAAVARIIAEIRIRFPVEKSVEITLEANPTDAEAAHFRALADAGINRLSMGVQSLDDAALTFLGRNHSAAEARRAIDVAARVFDRLSIDLIYARPGQTVADWQRELTDAVDLGFEHVSPYQLTLEPTTAFGRAFARGTLVPPDEDLAAELYETTQTVLSRFGFDAYEVSNHARGVAARSAHNLHVWRGGDYLGIGPGAHGRLTLDGTRTATMAHRRIGDYVEGVRIDDPWTDYLPQTEIEANEEQVLLGLRTVEGVPVTVMEALGLNTVSGRIGDLVADGFLVVDGQWVVATETGRPVLDAVLKVLLT